MNIIAFIYCFDVVVLALSLFDNCQELAHAASEFGSLLTNIREINYMKVFIRGEMKGNKIHRYF